MSNYIYSLKIICNGDSFDKTRNDNIGFYPDYIVESNPAVILWTESNLTSGSNDQTTIDGYLASRYAQMIMETGDIESTFDTDNPVVNINELSLTVWNGSKALLYLKDNGIDLNGLVCTLSLNQYSTSGTLITSTKKLYGVISNVNFDETKIYLTLSNNKYNKAGNVLKDKKDIFTIGTSASDTHYKLSKIDPAFERLTFGEISSFRMVGVSTSTNYQVHSYVNLQTYTDQYNKIEDSFLYVSNSSYDTIDQYSKVVSITPIALSAVSNPYQTCLPSGHYYQIEITTALKNKMTEYNQDLLSQVVDMYTFFEFHHLNFEYNVSKIPITGNIENLYIKQDEKIVSIPRSSTSGSYWDVNYSITSANTIKINPNYIEDKETIKTYTIVPLTSLENISDDTLIKWQFSKVKPNTLFGEMFKRNRVVNGLYKKPTSSVTATANLYNPQSISDRILNYTNSSYQATASHNVQSISPSNDSVIVALQASLPAMPDAFTFDKCFLGICANVWSNNHIKSIDNESAIKILTREQSGNINKIADIELINNGVLNNIPLQYYDTFDYGTQTQLKHDWVQWLIDLDTTNGVSRYTTLEKYNLNVDSIEDYNKLEKVGLFFARTASNGIIESTINIMEMCFIFEHKISLNDVYI